MARFLVDESLPRAVGRRLVSDGHDVLDVRDAGLRGRSDDEVLAHAIEENRILISGDIDFANALRFPPGSHAGIFVLRLPTDWQPSLRADRAASAIAEALAYAAIGALIIVTPSRIRVLMPS